MNRPTIRMNILSDGRRIGSIKSQGVPVTLTPESFGPGYSRLGIIRVHVKAGSQPGRLQAVDDDRRRRTKKNTKKLAVTAGSGNVFADLGLPDAAAELVKAQLTFQLAKHIKALGLTRTAAAQRLGVSQPDVSRLMKNRPTGFSTDRLLAMLNALDLDIDIVLRPSSPAPHIAKVRIMEERP